MPPDCLDLDIQSSVMSSYDADGVLSCSPDAYGELDATVEPHWSHHPLGFIGRPLDPALDGKGQADPTQSSMLLVGTYGPNCHAWPLEDVRVMPLIPQLQKGESLQYGPYWGNFSHCRADGTVSMVTTEKPASGGASAQTYLAIGPDGSLEFASKYGRVIFGSSGFHVNHISGARLDMGALSGFPAPLDAVASHFSVQAGIASIDVVSHSVNCAP